MALHGVQVSHIGGPGQSAYFIAGHPCGQRYIKPLHLTRIPMLKPRTALIGLALLPLGSALPAADQKPASPVQSEQKAPDITPGTVEDAKNIFNGKDLTG